MEKKNPLNLQKKSGIRQGKSKTSNPRFLGRKVWSFGFIMFHTMSKQGTQMFN